jgi:phytoene dehydrogenase-like protein
VPQSFETAYDVAIIGAGVSGLTAAALLSKAGLRVLVLEKEPHPGGYLAGFQRKKFRFDTAIHWLNQYGPGGTITRLFSLLGDDFPRAAHQREIRRFIGKGYDYVLTDDPDALKRTWQAEFPEDSAGIERFFAAARRIAAAFRDYGYVFRSTETMGKLEGIAGSLKMLRFAIPFIPFLRYSGPARMEKGLRKYFSNAALRGVFASDTEMLSCLIPIAWAYNGDFQSPPLGGGQRIPEWLEHVIRAHYGTIGYRCTVSRVLTENGRVSGVAFSQRGVAHEVKAHHIVAACDAQLLYEKLLPADAVPQKMKDQLRKAELYDSSVTLSIALDCDPTELGFGEPLVHLASAAGAPAGCTNDPATAEISILAPSVRDRSLAPAGQGILTIYMPATMDFRNNWQMEPDTEGNMARGEAYRALKHHIAEAMIDRVIADVSPELRQHILFYDVATPVTHWRYTGNRGGTMMGAKPGRYNMQNRVARYRTPVKGLLLGGHWAELGGGVPIAVKAGSNAALIVLQELLPELASRFAAFMDGKLSVALLSVENGWLPAPNNWNPRPTPASRSAAA